LTHVACRADRADNLRDILRRRSSAPTGMAIMAFPSKNIWDPDFWRFRQEVRGAAAGAGEKKPGKHHASGRSLTPRT
jgi:hypothetical protein